MTAIANPLMVGMVNPINNDIKKQNPVFGMSDLSFVPTLNVASQQYTASNRPTTLFGQAGQNDIKPSAPMSQQQVTVQPVYATPLSSPPLPQQQIQLQQVQDQQLMQQQQLLQQQQMQQQQAQQQQQMQQPQMLQSQMLQPQMQQPQMQQPQMQQPQMQQAQMQQQQLPQQYLLPQQQASQPIPAQAQMQAPGVQQGSNSTAISKSEVMASFRNSIVISLETLTSPNVSHVEARGLNSAEVTEVAKLVAQIKKQNDKKKMIQILLFGMIGYFLWQSGKMGTRLYLRLNPILEKQNQELAVRGINVRFAWTEGELRAYF